MLMTVAHEAVRVEGAWARISCTAPPACEPMRFVKRSVMAGPASPFPVQIRLAMEKRSTSSGAREKAV